MTRLANRLTDPLNWVRLAGILLFTVPSLLVTKDRSFDLQYHLFFAHHYQVAWFQSWEPAWYQGFSVYSYPPLAHQVLAILGSALGLDLAARVLGVITMLGLYLALARLARLLGGSDGAYGFGVVVLGWTAPFVFLFVWGQLPTLIAFVFALFGLGSLLGYLRHGNPRDLLLWSLLAGCCAGSHHQTGFFLIPLLGAAGIGTAVLGAAPEAGSIRRAIRRVARRSVAAAVGAIIAVGATDGPLLWWLATQNLPQAPIPHPTRTNFFADPTDTRLFFVCVWGLLIAILPFALWLGVQRKRFLPLSLSIGCCAILGLGTITPLPRLLFWGWTNWLTYEPFGLWASGLTAVVAGCWLGKTKPLATLALAIGSMAASVVLLTGSVLPNQGLPANDTVVRSLNVFLHTGDNGQWRYLTFGLGANRLSRLSRISGDDTVDGFYFMARSQAFLRDSGIATVDDAVDYPEGLAVIDRYLFHPDSFGLRWIFSVDTRLDARLTDAGWHLGGTAPATCKNMSLGECAEIWEAPNGRAVPLATATALRPPKVPIGFGVLWGTASLGELLAVISLGVWPLIHARRNANTGPPRSQGQLRTVDAALVH